MRRADHFLSLMLAALLLLAPFRAGTSGFARPADKDREGAPSSFAELKRGMTPQQVRQRVGAPKHVSRQLFYHRYREQWLYDAAIPIRLTFDCPRGQKPQLLDTTQKRP